MESPTSNPRPPPHVTSLNVRPCKRDSTKPTPFTPMFCLKRKPSWTNACWYFSNTMKNKEEGVLYPYSSTVTKFISKVRACFLQKTLQDVSHFGSNKFPVQYKQYLQTSSLFFESLGTSPREK